MLDVSVFRNLRFSAASISITFVFFALMGVMYFLTTYLQSVLGYSALEAGVRMLPIAVGMIVASKLSVGSTRRSARRSSSPRPGAVAGALGDSRCSTPTPSTSQIAMALGTLGQGMGLAMSPATDAIMGALPKAKAGIGSAMNDVVRELGGTLGIAVLGSILSSYGSGMDDATAGLPARGGRGGERQRRRRPRGRRPDRRRRGAKLIDAADRRSSTRWPRPRRSRPRRPCSAR